MQYQPLPRTGTDSTGTRITGKQFRKIDSQKRINRFRIDDCIILFRRIQQKIPHLHAVGIQSCKGTEAAVMIKVRMRQDPCADNHTVSGQRGTGIKISKQIFGVTGISSIPNQPGSVLQQCRIAHAVAVGSVAVRIVKRQDRKHRVTDSPARQHLLRKQPVKRRGHRILRHTQRSVRAGVADVQDAAGPDPVGVKFRFSDGIPGIFLQDVQRLQSFSV